MSGAARFGGGGGTDGKTAVSMTHDKDDVKIWDWPLQQEEGGVKILNNKDKFSVGLHVHEFTPKEIKVNVVNNEVVISCSHDDRPNMHGRIARSVSRAYQLPADVNVATLKSHLTAKGVLEISAEKHKGQSMLRPTNKHG